LAGRKVGTGSGSEEFPCRAQADAATLPIVQQVVNGIIGNAAEANNGVLYSRRATCERMHGRRAVQKKGEGGRSAPTKEQVAQSERR
jgi:hypothetical protein